MRRIDQLLERLEMRRMSIPGYQATWCCECLRCSLSDPAIRKDFVLLDAGDADCQNVLQYGTIGECIADLRTSGVS